MAELVSDGEAGVVVVRWTAGAVAPVAVKGMERQRCAR